MYQKIYFMVHMCMQPGILAYQQHFKWFLVTYNPLPLLHEISSFCYLFLFSPLFHTHFFFLFCYASSLKMPFIINPVYLFRICQGTWIFQHQRSSCVILVSQMNFLFICFLLLILMTLQFRTTRRGQICFKASCLVSSSRVWY